MKTCLQLLVILVLVCSCAIGTVKVTKPYGETAIITLRNTEKLKGELLAISDTLLYYYMPNKLYITRIVDIKKIFILEYTNRRSLKMCAIIPSLAIEGCVAVVAFSVDQSCWGYISIVTMVVTALSITGGNPQVDFELPVKENDEGNDMEKLRLYCRYPQGLSDKQWEELIYYSDQEGFIIIPGI